jgi:hypothetical protein
MLDRITRAMAERRDREGISKIFSRSKSSSTDAAGGKAG